MSGRLERMAPEHFTLYDLHHPSDRLRDEAILGLSLSQKALPPKYFYDERGARLFEVITRLPAYYPTRTELSVLEENLPEISLSLGEEARLVEFGSGSGRKTWLLLEGLRELVGYVPIDISREQLVAFARSVSERFPELEVTPICADYTRVLTLPPFQCPAKRTVAFFPGSTIGNFLPEEAQRFLGDMAHLAGSGGGLLIGVDLWKDPEVLRLAYNDPEGVTAEFNRNLLLRLNRECGTNFQLAHFRHEAVVDEQEGRVEMRLVSLCEQRVRFPGEEAEVEIAFREGEWITTEYSYKYTPARFRELAEASGWEVERLWKDERAWFSVQLLRVP